MKNSGILGLFSTVYAENSVRKTEYIQSEFSKICDLPSLQHINKTWTLYIRMIDLLHINLMAERSESWDMHIYSLECMLT